MPLPAFPFNGATSARPSTVSILVNNFNYGRYLGEAIESALAQTHAAEVIVVDDGSTDNSRQVIESYGQRIRSIFKANGGQGSAMNAGFAAATGDVVMFLDSDDKLEPQAVATVLNEWQPGVLLVQFPLRIITTSGEVSGIHPDPPESLSQGDVRPRLLDTGSFGLNVTTGLAFLREALLRVMPVPEEQLRICAEGYIARAVAFLGPVQRLGVPMGCYRSHDRNFSNLAATDGGLPGGFRKKIRHADMEFGFTRAFAAAHALPVGAGFEERDAEYVGYWLFLLIVDPAAHAPGGATRGQLFARYAALRWRSAWRLRRRLVVLAVVAVATLSPARLGTRLVAWLHDSNDRPSWWRLAANLLRGSQ